MNLVACTVAVSFLVASVHADLKVPADGPKYFDNALDEIQGALQDTIRAGLDLETMESRLQSVVDASSFFFRSESAVEYAVASDAYKNLWNNGGSSGKLKTKLTELFLIEILF